jgi:hypothetical protein
VNVINTYIYGHPIQQIYHSLKPGYINFELREPEVLLQNESKNEIAGKEQISNCVFIGLRTKY